MPHEILQRLFDALFPTLRRKLTRTVTIPATMTITSQRGDHIPPGAKIVPYVSFEAVVGRNSAFPLISEEQMEVLFYLPILYDFKSLRTAVSGTRGR